MSYNIKFSYEAQLRDSLPADFKRVEMKLDNLKDLLFEYTKIKYTQYEEIKKDVVRFGNNLPYYRNYYKDMIENADDILRDIESNIDRMIIELKKEK